MNYWWTSDYHFSHFNIIRYCKRPFETAEEMNETIIKRHNERVKPDDTVFFLGDFIFKGGKEGGVEKYRQFEKRLNGKFIFIKGNHDRNNSLRTIITKMYIHYGSKLMFQQLGSFAEFERNRIAERVFPGMVKGVQQGNWQGARYAPYGYKYNKEKKLLEIDEHAAKVVKLIYTMFLCDKSIFAITEYLTKKGYRNRKGNIFSTKLIGDILKNRIYTGKLVWNRHYYDKTQKTKKGYRYIKNPPDKVIISQGKHQPIIPDEDFEAVQEKLKARRIERRKKANDYPLSGILYCTKCNHKYLGISSISNHRTGVKKRWYRCAGPYRSFIRCKNKSVKAIEIESEVAEVLETLRGSVQKTILTG